MAKTSFREISQLLGWTPYGFWGAIAIIGVCFGYECRQDEFCLDGIAIIHPHNGLGKGGKLLAFFETQVAALGYKKISLGSADGYVEKFYLKNGYTPTELKMYAETNDWEAKSKGYKYPVAYTQQEGERLKL